MSALSSNTVKSNWKYSETVNKFWRDALGLHWLTATDTPTASIVEPTREELTVLAETFPSWAVHSEESSANVYPESHLIQEVLDLHWLHPLMSHL